MNNLRWIFLSVFLLFLSIGHNKLIANGNNDRNTQRGELFNNESEEICDQRLAHITADYGGNFYVLCLETDENNRIKGFHYNTYRRKTSEFVNGKAYNEDELGLHNCTPSHLNKVSHEMPLRNQNSQATLNNTNTVSNQLSLNNDVNFPVAGDNTNFENCISNQTIDMGSTIGFSALYLQTSHFSVDQGGYLYLTYLSSPFDRSYETLGLHLFKYNNNWILSDLNNQRITALDVDLNKPWYLIKALPSGINDIRPIYEEDLSVDK